MTENQSTHPKHNGTAADPEVEPMPKRRTFSAEYKLRILEEAGQSTEMGEIRTFLTMANCLLSGSSIR